MPLAHADALLISDIHLSPAHPRTVTALFAFLATVPQRAGCLIILGDLFDSWVGDDDRDDPFIAAAVARLRAVTAAGVALQLMVGNRDFLIGPDFAAATGATLLDDPTPIRFGQVSCLLSHGDALCTDDTSYQAFRAMVRNPEFQANFLRRSLAERKAIAADVRGKSEAHKRDQSDRNGMIMDVNAGAVQRLFAETGASVLIHGHTHRPGREVLEIDGRTCERLVLPDWDADANPPRGGGLRIDGDKINAFGFDDLLK